MSGRKVYVLSEEDRWTLAQAFIKEYGLARQHIDSYNRFVEELIHEVIKEYREIKLEGYDVKFFVHRLIVGRPTVKEVDGTENDKVTPFEARVRNLTYAAPMYLEVTVVHGGVEESPERVYIGDLPVMIKSVLDPTSRLSSDELVKINEDPWDPGGYFIVNGSERVLIAQEDVATNRVLVDEGKPGTNVTFFAKVISSTGSYRISVMLDMHKDGTLHVSWGGLPVKIPFVVMMRALGLVSDQEIVYATTFDPELQMMLLPSLESARTISTQEEALDFIGSKFAIGQPKDVRVERAKSIIDKYFLPHLGTTPESRIRKAYFLAQMANSVLELATGRRAPDDRDHYANKRLKLAGDLLASMFRVAFKQFVKDLKYQAERTLAKSRKLRLASIARPDIITDRLKTALATGNWVGGRTGVSQLLDRTNWMSTLSHLRRVVSPLSRTQPLFKARDVHGTQWGRICPFETPEGPNCGLVKNLAVLTQITVGTNEEPIEELLYKLGVEPLESVIEKVVKGEEEPKDSYRVYVNGRLVGYAKNGREIARTLIEMRRKGKISHEVNVAYHELGAVKEVYVNTDAGRVRRPLIVVENGLPRITKKDIEDVASGKKRFSDLVKEGKIEFLDAEEEENAYIALYSQDLEKDRGYTHLEPWLLSIFGVAAGTIPYIQHNQSPRNTYQAAMVKQALGLYQANFYTRTDSRSHVFSYPEKPLVQTKALGVIGYNDRPAGQNAVVAVMSYTGYNIEDALVFNRSSVERGFMRSTFYRLYTAEERKYPGGQEDKVCIPESGVRGYRGLEYYRHLDTDGIVSPEVEVSGGDVLIGRVSPPRFAQEFGVGFGPTARKDTSVALRHGERGVVDEVFITENQEGDKVVKVKVRDYRIPELGDKFASRHGQKGVVGLMVSQADMPYTEDGIVPDIVINPHAFPSRMTLGQLIESLAGKLASLQGKEIDGTPFSGISVIEIKLGLMRRGYNPEGTEVMYDGRTGRLIQRPIFIGVVYYQRLHHMVADKFHARPRGPVQLLTRQPTEGRAREGGLRFGEMERDALIGHGTSLLIKERLLDSSDKVTIYVCNTCGHVGWFDRNRNRYVCPIHDDKGELNAVEVSYAFKLLVQELMSMGIAVRLKATDLYSKW